jgi:3-deoxy-manno-octulosonate cytidylyltransferase (CMP-KDO synthetase)
MNKILIVIPVRYDSTRFPGKPLAIINGKSMLDRVINLAKKSLNLAKSSNCDIVVCADHEKLLEVAKNLQVKAVVREEYLPSGTDAARYAISKLSSTYDYAINLQGDAPLTPPNIVADIIKAISQCEDKSIEVITPVTKLSWSELDSLRESKKTTPFSGCTVCLKWNGDAHWFSKTIIPSIREEAKLRNESDSSPIWRHLGLYGYRVDILNRYNSLRESPYETLEGLEQLRFIENDIRIKTVPVSFGGKPSFSGIDSPEDLVRANNYIATYGDPYCEV